MGLAGIVASVVLAAAAQAAPDAAGSSADLPGPIYTRQTLFAIPFRMNEPAQQGRDGVEVFLFVSTDHGATWQFHSQSEPERGQFLFRAGSDGEFWFLIRTALRGTRVKTPAAEKPGLRVMVDTAQPKLKLEAQRGAAGQIVVRWQIADTNLKPNSLKIQYRTGSDSSTSWQPVAIDRTSSTTSDADVTGQASWWQSGQPQRIEIRGEVADLAGNTAISHAQIAATATVGESSSGEAPSAEATARPTPPAPPRDAPGPQLNAPNGSQAARASESQWRPIRHVPTRTMPGAASGPAAAPGGGSSGSTAWSSQPSMSAVSQPGQGPAVAPLQTPSAGQSPSLGVQAQPPLSGSLGPGEPCRVVHTPTFALEYDLGLAQPAPTDLVELWGTRDGGRTWSCFGTDTDQRSPVLVTVTEEGIYGFRIGLRRGGALFGETPPRGTPADLWVVVRITQSPTTSLYPGSARILDAQPLTPGPADQRPR